MYVQYRTKKCDAKPTDGYIRLLQKSSTEIKYLFLTFKKKVKNFSEQIKCNSVDYK